MVHVFKKFFLLNYHFKDVYGINCLHVGHHTLHITKVTKGVKLFWPIEVKLSRLEHAQ